MSIDLVVNNPLNGNLEAVRDQDENASALELSTKKVRVISPEVQTNPFTVRGSTEPQNILAVWEGGQGHGNLRVNTAQGETKVQLAAGSLASYINNGENFGIGTDDPQKKLDVHGHAQVHKLSITNMKSVFEAPDPSSLVSIVMDQNTGTLYYV